MNPIQSNGVETQNAPLYERIDKVDITKTDKLSQELAGLTEEVNTEINNAFSKDGDGGAKVTSQEKCGLNIIKSSLCSLNYKIKTSIQNASDEAKQVYKQMLQNVSTTIDRLTEAENGVNPDIATLEPKDTDAQERKYTHLDKRANQLLQASIDEDKARINSEKKFAFNPGYRDRKPRPSNATIDQIKDLYMTTYAQDGRRVRGFADPEKINQLLNWANSQLKADIIDKSTFLDLTKDAVAALDKIYSYNNDNNYES